jgi:hypothetical protein
MAAIEHHVGIAGCESPEGPFLAGCECGWMAEIRDSWAHALEDARLHLLGAAGAAGVRRMAS